MSNKKISIDLDIEDLLNLKEPNKNILEYDLKFILNNGMEQYLKNIEEYQEEKRKFIELFKECYDELCLFMEKDSLHRVPISCFTCIKGMDLSKKYGRPKKK